MEQNNQAGKGVKKVFKPSSFIAIIFVVLIAVCAFSSAFIVDESQQAVMTRFGAYTKTLGPGLHFKLPFGIDKKYIVDGNQIIRTGFPAKQACFRIDAAVHFNMQRQMFCGELLVQKPDFREYLRHKSLSALSGIYRHHQNKIFRLQYCQQREDGFRRRIG